MIDLTKMKAPGWQRVVGELTSHAPDDRTFLAKLTAVVGQVSGARQAVLFGVENPSGAEAELEPRPLLIWTPTGGIEAPNAAEIDSAHDVLSATRSAASSGQTRVFGIEPPDGIYEDQGQGYVVAGCVPQPQGTPANAPTQVIALSLEQRSKQALQTTLALIEVLLGYSHGHALAQALRRTQSTTAALDLATRLIGAINQSPGFKGASIQLANDLSRQLSLDRVAIGWVKGVGKSSGVIRVVAISDTEQIDRRMDMVRALEGAMDECLDQEQAVMHPAPDEREDVLLSQAITHEHRKLASSDASLRVASVPLRDGDEVVGVVTVERAGEESPLDVRVVEWLQAAMDLVTPVMKVRRSDDRFLATRAWGSTVKAGAWFVGPKHTVWKLVGILLLALILTVTFVKLPYKVDAPFELQSRAQRVVSAPFAGVIERLGEGVAKGGEINKGDLLIQMRTTEVALAMEQAIAQRIQAQARADAAMEAGDTFERTQAEAEVRGLIARIDQLNYNLERAQIRAPIDGVIVDGELERRIGSTIELGEAMMVIAQLQDLEFVGRVDDRDISYVREGMSGALARKSRPGERIPITVDRVVPLGRPEEGANVFEIRGSIDFDAMDPELADDFRASLRPGMEGTAKLETGDHSIAWILSRRIRDTLRMWLWF